MIWATDDPTDHGEAPEDQGPNEEMETLSLQIDALSEVITDPDQQEILIALRNRLRSEYQAIARNEQAADTL